MAVTTYCKSVTLQKVQNPSILAVQTNRLDGEHHDCLLICMSTFFSEGNLWCVSCGMDYKYVSHPFAAKVLLELYSCTQELMALCALPFRPR